MHDRPSKLIKTRERRAIKDSNSSWWDTKFTKLKGVHVYKYIYIYSEKKKHVYKHIHIYTCRCDLINYNE